MICFVLTGIKLAATEENKQLGILITARILFGESMQMDPSYQKASFKIILSEKLVVI